MKERLHALLWNLPLTNSSITWVSLIHAHVTEQRVEGETGSQTLKDSEDKNCTDEPKTSRSFDLFGFNECFYCLFPCG